jgi:glycine oxidase
VNRTEVDYIIVGQGLAGSAVALHLLERDKKILVIDELDKNTSSRVAAGLFNPISGQNSVRTWMGTTLFPYLESFYQKAERLTGQKFFYQRQTYRPFASVLEQNDWMAKSAEPESAFFIDEIVLSSRFSEVKDPFGGLLLKRCGYVNTTRYVDAVRQTIRSRCHLLEEAFDVSAFSKNARGVNYRHFEARVIIFCQGVRALENPLFTNFPIRPLKGETLTVKSSFSKDVILNRGVYMVPGEVSGQFRVGATYVWKDPQPGITSAGRVEIEGKLTELLNLPFEVVGQDWGVRPAVVDRRPLLGSHPECDRMIIFNGLGTKGVSLAPYFSNVLICWLENSGTLPREVILTRYK